MRVYHFTQTGPGAIPWGRSRWSADPRDCGAQDYQPTGRSRDLTPGEYLADGQIRKREEPRR